MDPRNLLLPALGLWIASTLWSAPASAQKREDLSPGERRAHAELIRDRLRERGAKEVLLFDRDRVLRGHWTDAEWRAPSDWSR